MEQMTLAELRCEHISEAEASLHRKRKIQSLKNWELHAVMVGGCPSLFCCRFQAKALTLVALAGHMEVQPVMQCSVSARRNLGGFPQFLLEYLLAAALPI